MAKLINVTADPCKDFAEFACGRFYKEVKLKEGIYSTGAVPTVDAANREIVQEIITESISPQDPQYLINMKRYYKSCMDLDQIEKIGVGPFLNNTDFINDWPTLNPAWNESAFNLNDVVARYYALFIAPLCKFGVYATEADHTKEKVQISPPDLDLAVFTFLSSGAEVEALQTFLTEFAVALGAEANVSAEDAKDVVDLEKKLAQMIFTSAQLARPGEMNTTTLSQLGDLFPNIDIARALRSAVGVAGISLPDDKILVLYPVEYLELLNTEITQYSPRALQNLFAFSHALSQLDDMSNNLREIRTKFNKAVNPSYQDTSRMVSCMQKTSAIFKTGLSKQYVDRTFTDEAKHYVEDMVDDIKSAFRQMVMETTWMASDTKTEAYRKLDQMGTDVGYPDAYAYHNYVETFYENYTMTEANYYNNSALVFKLITIQGMRASLLPGYEYETDVSVVNAFYSRFFNTIDINAGILQPPLFSLIFPDYFNYGAIGAIIGHEITHAFDREGSLLDADGNPNNWWKEDDRVEYLNKTQCLIDQYSRFYVEEVNMTINGDQTVEENLSDTVGLKIAFRAYKEEQKRTGGQLPLPGLDLTQDQLFFLSFGQFWCTKDSPEILRYMLSLDSHPPGKFRLIGPLQNSEGFAKAYNCPRGSYMNPEVKCQVW